MINFKVRPWRYVAFCDKCAGYWPDHSWLKKSPVLAYHFTVCFTIMLALVYDLTKNIGIDHLVVIRCILALMFVIASLSKLFTIGMNQKKRQRIYQKICETFDEAVDEDEAKLLSNSADQGLRYTVIYLSICATISSIFMSIPLSQTCYGYFFGDGRLVVHLPIEIDYGVDPAEHFLLIYSHFGLLLITQFAMTVAYDYSLIMQVKHACALITIFKLRMDRCARLFSESGDQTDQSFVENEAHSLLIKSIDLHKTAYKLISLIEEGHSSGFFVLLLVNTSLFGGQIHIIASTVSEPLESTRHLLILLILLTHFYVIFSQGQAIIDSTSGILQDCYDCEWYYLPKKMRVIWLIIMVCSSKPREITGGKLFVLSLETYSKMLKAGISYYTVFQQ